MGPGADQGGQARDTFGLVGTTIAGKFRVERVLGEGGFGVVYAGTHVMLGERVAIKCLKPVGFTPEDRERGAQAFLREGRILFGLGHPAIVRLYDVGVIEDGQIPYVVLELLTGTTLAAEIASRAAMRRHFTRDELVELWTPVLEAVAFAHERGIVHRDLKPPNLMLVSEGGRMQPKVLDFGTARSDLVGSGRAAATGAPEASLGKTGFTPLYAAPEQWDAFYGTTGPQTDVYALGLTLAEVCVLGYPMDVATGGILAVFKASLDDGARPLLSRSRPDLPSELERVVLRAMRPRPADRFADARELLAAFRAAMKLAPPAAAVAPPPPMHAPPQPAPQLQPSYGPPPGQPSYGPPPSPPYASYAGASTTQPHAVSAQSMHSPQGAPVAPRPSVVPWILGIGALVIVVVVLAVGVVAALVMRSSASHATAPVVAPSAAPTAAPAAAPTATVSVAANPTGSARPRGAPALPGAPAATTAAATTPAATAPAPGAPPGATPKLIVSGAIGMGPFWTQGDVMDVARTHHGEMIQCAREAVAAQPGLESAISITVSPNKNGVVGAVQCSLRVHGTAGEAAFCGCASSAMGKWKFPGARAKLGALEAGPFIYDYRLFPP